MQLTECISLNSHTSSVKWAEEEQEQHDNQNQEVKQTDVENTEEDSHIEECLSKLTEMLAQVKMKEKTLLEQIEEKEKQQ